MEKPNFEESYAKISFSKCLLWSDTNCSGTLNRVMMWLKKKSATVSMVLLKVGMASAHLVK
jgi:hypothetical protein